MFKDKQETLLYLVFGFLTVAINIISYRMLILLLSDIPANTIAFFVALAFAYLSNCLVVFHQHIGLKSAVKFILMRIGTLLVDNGGMLLLLSWNFDRLIAKFLVNIVIIILNYLFSKFFVFKVNLQENQKDK